MKKFLAFVFALFFAAVAVHAGVIPQQVVVDLFHADLEQDLRPGQTEIYPVTLSTHGLDRNASVSATIDVIPLELKFDLVEGSDSQTVVAGQEIVPIVYEYDNLVYIEGNGFPAVFQKSEELFRRKQQFFGRRTEVFDGAPAGIRPDGPFGGKLRRTGERVQEHQSRPPEKRQLRRARRKLPLRPHRESRGEISPAGGDR